MSLFEHVYSVPLDHPSARIFWPLYGDQPFQHCLICELPVRQGQDPYLIERAFHGSEPVFEYAMCWACRQRCESSLSAESSQRIVAHLEEHVDFEARAERLLAVAEQDLGPWLQECVLTRRKREDCRSYQIAALAFQDRILLGAMPLMISSAAAEQLYRLFSRKTREALDDFTEQFLGTPPEYRKLLF